MWWPGEQFNLCCPFLVYEIIKIGERSVIQRKQTLQSFNFAEIKPDEAGNVYNSGTGVYLPYTWKMRHYFRQKSNGSAWDSTLSKI